MNQDSGVNLRLRTVVLASVFLVLSGAGAAFLWTRYFPPTASVATPQPSPATSGPISPAPGPPSDANASAAGNQPALPDVTLTLTDEAVQRARIEVVPVATVGEAGRMRIPGIVQPNAYRSVTVTSLVGGRVTRVLVELGQMVRRGATMAEVYSPELADAQARDISARAELTAHERELNRTGKLVEIGAASRQELEKLHAEHTAATTMVESARSRLTLLGLSEAQVEQLATASDVNAMTRIMAPIAGVVTARGANVGLNVDAATPLFTVVDLSTVWIVGDLYENAFSRVRIGTPVTVTTAAYPDLRLEGRISYLDPQVKPETRTAQVRVEVPNRQQRLRLGMYGEMEVGTSAEIGVTIPRTAVQMVGDRSVVYVVFPSERGRFIEREVRLGDASGDHIAVMSGLQRGDVVVAKGSFSIRAERERLGLRTSAADRAPMSGVR